LDYIKAQLGGVTGEQGSGVSTMMIRQNDLIMSTTQGQLLGRTLGSSLILAHPTLGKIGAGQSPQPYLGDSRQVTYTDIQNSASNKFTNDGVKLVRGFLANDSINYPQYLALGSSSAAPTATQTTLGSEYESTRFEVGSTARGTNYIDVFYDIPSTLPTENSYAVVIREWGTFDSSSEGSMFSRSNCSAYTKNVGSEYRVRVRHWASGA